MKSVQAEVSTAPTGFLRKQVSTAYSPYTGNEVSTGRSQYRGSQYMQSQYRQSQYRQVSTGTAVTVQHKIMVIDDDAEPTLKNALNRFISFV